MSNFSSLPPPPQRLVDHFAVTSSPVPHLALGLVRLGRLGRGVQVGHSSVEIQLVRRRRLAPVLGVDVGLLRDGRALLGACQLTS